MLTLHYPEGDPGYGTRSGDDTSMVWGRGHPNVRQARDALEEATAVGQHSEDRGACCYGGRRAV
ncbi:hypothetical protein E2C01_028812 [Portunus trituberculatus]|uniref:Uncharacterized protein n=1 Tax=Portunus trituberculatus TaxID=210409 RepID=A0A5B7ELG2_PORTR|nr:hypothetical protein [Portunus trituberculatus]